MELPGNAFLPLLLSELEKMSEQERDLIFRSVNRFGQEVVCWFDNQDHIRYISPNCLTLFGWEMSQFMQRPELLEQVIYPDDRSLWRRHSKRGREEIELRIVTSGGTQEWMEYRCLPLIDAHGKHCGRIGTFMNISRRHAVQHRAQALALALEQSPTGIVVTGADGNVLYANEAFHALRCNVIGAVHGNKLDLFTLEYQDQLSDLWDLLQKGESWKGEKVCEYAGREQIVELIVTPVVDEMDQVSLILFLVQDVTRERHDQQLLQQQHEQLQQLFAKVEKISREWELSFDCIDDIIFLMDGAGQIQRINQAVERHYHVCVKKLVGRSVDSFLPKSVVPQFFADEQGEFFDERVEKSFSWQAFEFLKQSEETRGVRVVTLHDVTEMRALTDQLEKAYESQKAAQSQLVQQEKMASIGQLAAGVAHEINNPVGFIRSNLNTLGKYLQRFDDHIDTLEHLLQQTGQEELIAQANKSRKEKKLNLISQDAVQLIEESVEGTNRVSVIVQNLKSFSRVDDTGLRWADLNECLEASLSIAWNEIKYNSRIEKDYGDLPQVLCNPQQLNQVILNLLVNAAQAIEQQGVITLKSWADSQWAYISVQDTGCGMSPEVKKRIFDPFYTTKEVGKGTGLGLSICYDIISKHHGSISVDSILAQGTTFRIQLPLQPLEDVEQDSA